MREDREFNLKSISCIVKWHKVDPRAIVPTKREEDAGFDMYSIDDRIVLNPGDKKMFRTGLQYWIAPGWWLMGADRGSTGSKGIHIHCGICDQGYRGEVFICLSNDNTFPVVFTKQVDKVVKEELPEPVLYYPLSKAIAQLIPMPLPKVYSTQVTDEEWEHLANDSERGAGKLGASGK